MNNNFGRRQWTESRRRKEANLYDEWLKEERVAQQHHPAQQSQPAEQPSQRQRDTPLRQGDTAAGRMQSVGTIRAVIPDEAFDIDTGLEGEPFMLERETTSFERSFIPLAGAAVTLGTTTTITGGPAAADSSTSSPTSSGGRNWRGARERHKERESERDEWSRSRPSSPPGAKTARAVGMLGRSNSRNNGQHAQTNYHTNAGDSAQSSVRPRTRTLEKARKRDPSPTSLLKSRNRIGSVHSPSSPVYQGAEYLASVPAATSPPSAPSITSLGSAVQTPPGRSGRRSSSPMSSDTANSLPSTLPPASARRIVHLMKTLNGRMSGNVVFRRGETSPWSQSYCYVQEDSGRLMYEPRGGEGVHETLIPDLRGCSVIPNAEDETPYLEVSLADLETEVHVKLLTQSDFDAWFATFLWWQSSNPSPSSDEHRSTSSHSHGTASVNVSRPPSRTSSSRRDRAGSGRSDRQAPVHDPPREAAVIKIGKMIYWDTNVGYSNNTPGSAGQPSTVRPAAYRTQSHGSRRWRRISGQLRENGELKLHSDADNSLISVVQLSQLSRCAIQRLDPSVLDNDYCLAIYPQYTSSLSNTQAGFLRPIFLSLENRVLHEVWVALLRAFTLPQLYGPPRHSQNSVVDDEESSNRHSATISDMFRLERTFSVRIVEAKMYPPPASGNSGETSFSGGHNRGAQPTIRSEQHGYYAEILIDNETRGKTAVKYEGLNPLWGEQYEFADLPPVVGNASVVIKRRPPDSAYVREQHESKLVHEAYGFSGDQNGGYTGLTFDVTCGKVEIYLQELEEEKEVEKWWPVVNMYNKRVGEVLIKARAEEGVILMAHDYLPLVEVLHRFSNGLTLQIAQMAPGELKRLSDCLLNIFQVSGKAGEWLQALVEEEIDGIHKETPISRLRYSRRVGSNDNGDVYGTGMSHSDRELIVRDLNKNATLEANLLFRGNTLLTKSLDTHMRRVGREYLEYALAARVRDINDRDLDCEVDPNRVGSPSDLDRNWKRLLNFAQEVWKAIVTTKSQCPVELRVIFRHIRACAEDRYGDFLRSVSYSSVSGFLFLRFFCPAVLNPKLFGLLKDDIKPRARRTFTLLAKTLQTLANMASFGTKEVWMEPMNAFLVQHRDSFKGFIDDICYVPTPPSNANHAGSGSGSSSYPTGLVSTETHLSYSTPIAIMGRLPPTSREGFLSLPYLIDQTRAFAELVQLWMEVTSPMSHSYAASTGSKTYSEVTHAISASDGDMQLFHETCVDLHHRTQECLNRAERAERPNSALSFRWEELIDQLHSNRSPGEVDEASERASFDPIADRIASDPSILPLGMTSANERRQREWDPIMDEDEEDAHATGYYDSPPPHSSTATNPDANGAHSRQTLRERPGSTMLGSSIQGSLRRAIQSRGSDHSQAYSASASASNVSSIVSSDTEHGTGTTALPNYEREVRHRERREAARMQIQQQVEDAKVRDGHKESKSRVKLPLSALRKKKEKESGGGGSREGPGIRRGVDMSHV